MGRNYLVTAIVAAVVVLVVWRLAGGRGGTLGTAVESVKAGVEETVLPAADRPESHLVIRKAMNEQRRRENEEWTAANIQARPDLYIEHCRKMLSDYATQYGAAIIEARSAINLAKRGIKAAEEDAASYLGFLKQAKEALANPDAKWPAKVGAYTYGSAAQVGDAVVATDRKLSECEAMIAENRASCEWHENSLAELEKGRDRVARELRELEASAQRLKAGTLKNSVDGIRASIDALLSGVGAIPAVANSGPVIGRAAAPAATADDVFKRRGIE